MNPNHITIDIEALDFSVLLSDWSWLINDHCTPLIMNTFGDLFLEDEVGFIHMLDLAAGRTRKIANNMDDFGDMLDDKKCINEWFMPSVVYTLHCHGMKLKAGQCYGCKIPPSLNGTYAPWNIRLTDLEMHYALLGRMHEAFKFMPIEQNIGTTQQLNS